MFHMIVGYGYTVLWIEVLCGLCCHFFLFTGREAGQFVYLVTPMFIRGFQKSGDSAER